MCVDASKTGSVARFLNHCCEPNLFVQSVFVEYSRAVHRCVETSRPEASANSPSSTPRQRPIKLGAASSLGQPRPTGR